MPGTGKRRESTPEVPAGDSGATVPAGEQPQPAEPVEQQLSADLEAMQAEVGESRNRFLRLAADFENFKKRSRQEQVDTIQHANQSLIEALLPVLDDFHRALDHAPVSDEESWFKGLELTVQKLEDVLAAQGVRGIDAVGQPFDPKRHEAVGSEESEEAPEDTVLEELRRGYQLHDRVLRPALVKLARPPSGSG